MTGVRIELNTGMRPAQVTIYRKAIAPLQEGMLAAKAAPRQIFAGGKGRLTSSQPTPLPFGGSNK